MDHLAITRLVKTTDEQNELINLIEELIENNFKDKLTPSDNTLNSKFAKKLWEVVSAAIISEKISDDKKSIEKFLNSLLREVRLLNRLRITLAFEPNEITMGKLKRWAETNLSGNLIYDIEIDPQILGGTIIVSDDGKYADFSLSRKFNGLFLTRKQEILSLL